MKTYQLCVKDDERWTWLADIGAPTHADALRKAIGMPKPAHYDKPIRLEQVDAKPRRNADGRRVKGVVRTAGKAYKTHQRATGTGKPTRCKGA